MVLCLVRVVVVAVVVACGVFVGAVSAAVVCVRVPLFAFAVVAGVVCLLCDGAYRLCDN